MCSLHEFSNYELILRYETKSSKIFQCDLVVEAKKASKGLHQDRYIAIHPGKTVSTKLPRKA